MSNFWLDIQDKNDIGTFEVGGDLEPIPAKTQVLAYIEDIKWDEYEGVEYINIQWKVIKPEEYKGRVVFQKLKVKDADAKKRERAIRMLMAIDHNAKGGLVELGTEPTTEQLKGKLTNKPMLLMLQVWQIIDEKTGEPKKGNWVSAVAPRSADAPEKVVPVIIERKPSENLDFDDEVPF